MIKLFRIMWAVVDHGERVDSARAFFEDRGAAEKMVEDIGRADVIEVAINGELAMGVATLSAGSVRSASPPPGPYSGT